MQPIEHRAHRFRAHEGHVTIEDQHIAGKTGQRSFGLQHGMAGAQLRLLQGNLRAALQCRRQLLATVTRNNDLTLRR